MPEYTIELDTNSEDEFAYEDAQYELKDFYKRGSSQYYTIHGHNMGWQHMEGFIVVEFTKVLDALAFGNDYRLEFTIDEEKLDSEVKVWRFSHDEPCGASFEIRPATEEEVEEFA